MNHETVETIVPVVVARKGVDRTRIVLVGDVELLPVLVYIPSRIDDVAADDHELRILPAFEQRRHDRKLRLVSLAGVSDNEKLDRVEVRTVDDEVLRDILAIA